MSDGPVGVRGPDGGTSAMFPAPSALAATWDLDLARRSGALFAAEARRHGVDVVLAPQVNLQRTPVGGRHFECYSEDPHLTAEIAVALVGAAQDRGVGMCVKHYVANDSETERTRYLARLDERTLREAYLAPFERLGARRRPLVRDGRLQRRRHRRGRRPAAGAPAAAWSTCSRRSGATTACSSATGWPPSPSLRPCAAGSTCRCPGPTARGATACSTPSAPARSPSRSSTTRCCACSAWPAARAASPSRTTTPVRRARTSPASRGRSRRRARPRRRRSSCGAGRPLRRRAQGRRRAGAARAGPAAAAARRAARPRGRSSRSSRAAARRSCTPTASPTPRTSCAPRCRRDPR